MVTLIRKNLRRYPVPPSFEPSAAVDAQEAHGQFVANEDPLVQDCSSGSFDPLPYTPYNTFPGLPTLEAYCDQPLEYLDRPVEGQIENCLYPNPSVSIPPVEQFQQHYPIAPNSPHQPETQPIAEPSATVNNPTCPECQKTFARVCDLNVHKKSHTLPFKCPRPSCKSLGFRYRKDRDRHIADIHPELIPGAERYFCPLEGCKHSRAKGKGFPRKDNCARHVKNCKHRNK
ncbi:predicted protein [Sclerotinia sclerotiorum 1980 UF-70]|uniref:C2H2-type domain-containing protein n=2 Tax=Sclerotinia sclerotiorum (strain ATCC 18683 / 1980 / Ss-1) TaxID=665079 RepID=A7EYR9_SCLS1|nr:predicted protein [Sclerotinia sclerotiorum 1980 UF-70]APA16275.1 hypothetical protein sscle_16g110450 [Sclerotinia sclerotiorum 1980 UF-70]EDN94611.1 predicted protein [Sclerotinia sclerotiorum 1980 UF-70]